jgi:hypothetical protein
MGFLRKLKTWFGLAGQAVYITAPIVDEVAELAEKVRGVDLVGPLQSPNALCLTPGHYGLVRGGQLVERPDGSVDTCRLEVGQRFPPGLRAGDRWQLFASEGPFAD